MNINSKIFSEELLRVSERIAYLRVELREGNHHRDTLEEMEYELDAYEHRQDALHWITKIAE